jgi:alanine racemase
MKNLSETCLEVNLSALENNYTYLKSKLNTKTKFLAVVKANSYGSDAIAVAKKLESLKVDYLAVAYVQEGITLRNNGVKTPILVFHPQLESLSSIFKYNLEPSLYSFAILKSFLLEAESRKIKKYPIHLKFNTGLNRLGFKEKDCSLIKTLIEKSKTVTPVSVFSHLAASEDESQRDFTKLQITRFNSIIENIKATFNTTPIFHLCNTSGILNYPEAHYDMVRSGIGLYGFSNIPKEQPNFTPIASLKSVISQIHSLKKGESVGYNRAFICNQENQKIAVIPLGHADGINRAYGNGAGWVTINSQKAPIVGNVCMDMIMVNITNITCKEGDSVIVFGQHPTAEDLANAIHTISYELITSIASRVKRVFI